MESHVRSLIANATAWQVAFAPGQARSLVPMPIDPQEMERRRARLQDAIEHFGSPDALGKALGYKDGAFVRQLVLARRSVTEKTIAAIERLAGMAGWFATKAWPFEMVPAAVFDGLTEREKGEVEARMLDCINEIMARRASFLPPTGAKTSAQKSSPSNAGKRAA